MEIGGNDNRDVRKMGMRMIYGTGNGTGMGMRTILRECEKKGGTAVVIRAHLYSSYAWTTHHPVSLLRQMMMMMTTTTTHWALNN